MIRNAIAFTWITLSLTTAIAVGQELRNPTISPAPALEVQTKSQQSFTHFARIPADSEKDTIRFKGMKVVHVPTRITYRMNSTYCDELSFRDPGGSMFCPWVETGSPATAYEATYSYLGSPMGSDESGSRRFTFQVYFRPDELDSRARQALARKNGDRADLAAYFTVTTLDEPARRIVIDEAKSRFCDGNFVDGSWTHSDAGCKDEVYTTAIDGPSGYITVRVDPVPVQAGLASAGTSVKPPARPQ